MPKLPPQTISDDKIGDRLDWALDICQRAEMAPERIVGSWSLNFVNNFAERLEQYGSGTFVSPSQMEQLERIETQLEEAGL